MKKYFLCLCFTFFACADENSFFGRNADFEFFGCKQDYLSNLFVVMLNEEKLIEQDSCEVLRVPASSGGNEVVSDLIDITVSDYEKESYSSQMLTPRKSTKQIGSIGDTVVDEPVARRLIISEEDVNTLDLSDGKIKVNELDRKSERINISIELQEKIAKLTPKYLSSNLNKEIFNQFKEAFNFDESDSTDLIGIVNRNYLKEHSGLKDSNIIKKFWMATFCKAMQRKKNVDVLVSSLRAAQGTFTINDSITKTPSRKIFNGGMLAKSPNSLLKGASSVLLSSVDEFISPERKTPSGDKSVNDISDSSLKKDLLKYELLKFMRGDFILEEFANDQNTIAKWEIVVSNVLQDYCYSYEELFTLRIFPESNLKD